mmetsp:Transcript_24575/g.56309  ORF Transcript_24575/g.56309 Transcript_24575/m.56309 type:complete len:100 (+) Transcript_24575:568-867(+)
MTRLPAWGSEASSSSSSLVHYLQTLWRTTMTRDLCFLHGKLVVICDLLPFLQIALSKYDDVLLILITFDDLAVAIRSAAMVHEARGVPACCCVQHALLI